MHKNNSLAFASVLLLTAFFSPGIAAPADSAKAVSIHKKKSPKAPVIVKDSVKAVGVVKDTVKAAVVVKDTSQTSLVKKDSVVVIAKDSVGSGSTILDSSKVASVKKRKRIVRETTVNTIDQIKGQYRSPKKALFMSLIVPGLGQTYVGHHWVNYTRAAVYFLTDVALATGWNYYVVNKQDAQIAKYRKFADQNWRQSNYETFLRVHYVKDQSELVNQHRQAYCEAVQNQETNKGISLFAGCKDANPSSTNFQSFQSEYDDANWGGVDSISQRRANFENPHQFYELIGKEVEFITGWNDAGRIGLQDSTFRVLDDNMAVIQDKDGNFPSVTTKNQQAYIAMRAQANDYARMQAYFLGGMVVNHLISALDAALTAHYHNKSLYQTETAWYDRVHLDGGLTWQGQEPATTVTARMSF